MSYDAQAAWEWLLDNGSRFWFEEDPGCWDEDSCYEALLESQGLVDSPETNDLVFPLVARYSECYT